MKQFIFRLQIVLDHTLKEEEAVQLQFAKLQQEVLLRDQLVFAKNEERRHLMQVMAHMQQQVFDAWELHCGKLQLDVLGNELTQLRTEREDAKQRMLAKQGELVEIMRKRQTLEKLRDKHFDAYRKGEERTELQVMEEAVLPRLARAKAEYARFESR
ncbi:MAG: flagellar export protein FliJ [Armatimonadota bacterium]